MMWKKIIFVSLMVFLNVNVCYSETIDYVCESKTNFLRFYKINFTSQTVLFSKSKVSDQDNTAYNKGESFIINRYEKILDWDYPNIWTYGIDPYQKKKNYFFHHFDFTLNKLTTFVTGKNWEQTYKCF